MPGRRPRARRGGTLPLGPRPGRAAPGSRTAARPACGRLRAQESAARACVAEGPRGPRPREKPSHDFEGAHFPETGLPAPAGVTCNAPRNKHAMVYRLPGLLLSARPPSRLAGHRRGGRGQGLCLPRALRPRFNKKAPVVPGHVSGPRGLTLKAPPKQRALPCPPARWTRMSRIGGQRRKTLLPKHPSAK